MAVATLLAMPFAQQSRADVPLGYMTGFGPKADAVASLTKGLLGVSVSVTVIIALLLLMGLWRKRSSSAGTELVERPAGGLRWIYVGVGVSTLVLIGCAAWTFMVMAEVSDVPLAAGLTIEVTGHQWWWEVRYDSPRADRTFTTANEIHIPTDTPVLVKLIGSDVIHSFWVPALAGKTDIIPGQTNQTWLEASHPGVYRGQCTEYCGQQHAHMAFVVVAEPPRDFQAWWDDQLKGPPPAQTSERVAGEALFVGRCGACHAVRGTPAGGVFGPDLSHLMSRISIAAGTLPNTPGYLAGWIADPQQVKPGNHMPVLDLSGPELDRIRRFLETLR